MYDVNKQLEKILEQLLHKKGEKLIFLGFDCYLLGNPECPFCTRQQAVDQYQSGDNNHRSHCLPGRTSKNADNCVNEINHCNQHHEQPSLRMDYPEGPEYSKPYECQQAPEKGPDKAELVHCNGSKIGGEQVQHL